MMIKIISHERFCCISRNSFVSFCLAVLEINAVNAAGGKRRTQRSKDSSKNNEPEPDPAQTGCCGPEADGVQGRVNVSSNGSALS